MGLRYDEIGEILKLIDSSSCEEFVLETDDIKLVVRRRGGGNSAAHAVAAEAPPLPERAAAPIAPRVAAPSSSVAAAPPPATTTTAPAAEGLQLVKAPMVGTFYRASSPSEPPFVEFGSNIKKGDPLCIIEVMKLFTTIHAECDGRIVEIGADNAALVEYGQMLFVIDPS